MIPSHAVDSKRDGHVRGRRCLAGGGPISFMRCHYDIRHSGYKNGAKQSMTVHAVIAASSKLFVVLGLENLAATIKAVRANVVTEVGLACG